MDKPRIKFDTTYIPHKRYTDMPCMLINGFYRHNNKQWNAPEYMTIEAYENPKKRFKVHNMIINALIKRFKREASDA